MRAPYWWLWSPGRHWVMGETAYENSPEFKRYLSLVIELGGRANDALHGDTR